MVNAEGRSNGYQRREEEIVKSEKKAEKKAYGTGKTLSSFYNLLGTSLMYSVLHIWRYGDIRLFYIKYLQDHTSQ